MCKHIVDILKLLFQTYCEQIFDQAIKRENLKLGEIQKLDWRK